VFSPVAAEALCVTAGRLGSGGSRPFTVDVGGMRAFVAGAASPSVEIAFTYRGPSRETEPLKSGEVRRQIGLKLRAMDTCNVVYVMWHVEPAQGLFVSVKRNPASSTHESCGDHGYTSVRGTKLADVPEIRVGSMHTLRADLVGEVLHLTVDGVAAWEGHLPAEAFAFDGPVGVRSDNGAFDFELRVPGDRTKAVCP
jgi:hypothetical protein